MVGERSGKSIIFEKSGKMIMDHADCRYSDFLCLYIEKQANLQLPLNVQKLFQLQGGKEAPP